MAQAEAAAGVDGSQRQGARRCGHVPGSTGDVALDPGRAYGSIPADTLHSLRCESHAATRRACDDVHEHIVHSCGCPCRCHDNMPPLAPEAVHPFAVGTPTEPGILSRTRWTTLPYHRPLPVLLQRCSSSATRPPRCSCWRPGGCTCPAKAPPPQVGSGPCSSSLSASWIGAADPSVVCCLEMSQGHAHLWHLPFVISLHTSGACRGQP